MTYTTYLYRAVALLNLTGQPAPGQPDTASADNFVTWDALQFTLRFTGRNQSPTTWARDLAARFTAVGAGVGPDAHDRYWPADVRTFDTGDVLVLTADGAAPRDSQRFTLRATATGWDALQAAPACTRGLEGRRAAAAAGLIDSDTQGTRT